jgi:putative inorganic carbon (HCO3(-)) transporter
MWRERPLLGVGPGNFRHLYGQYLGMVDWDDRIYANNLYIEFAATLGILGMAAFGWLVLNVLRRALRAFARPPGAVAQVWLVGLVAGAGAFLLHGLLDYFLEVVSLYLLFWITLGLIVALSRLSSSEEGAV